jgi:hypothetical protein
VLTLFNPWMFRWMRVAEAMHPAAADSSPA